MGSGRFRIWSGTAERCKVIILALTSLKPRKGEVLNEVRPQPSVLLDVDSGSTSFFHSLHYRFHFLDTDTIWVSQRDVHGAHHQLVVGYNRVIIEQEIGPEQPLTNLA